MIGVVVDGADNDASRPGRDTSERGAFEIAPLISGLHVFHFTSVAGGDPFKKVL